MKQEFDEEKDPTVVMFGKNLSHQRHCHHHSSTRGIVLIFIGIFFYAIHLESFLGQFGTLSGASGQ